MWRVSQSSAEYLHSLVRTRSLQYVKIQSGKQKYGPRWKECVAISARFLPVATGALYVRTFFSENSKEIASEMVNSIKEEFENILKTVSWMDETTRAAALRKAEKIQNHIGYPDELMDDKKLIDLHKNLVINEHEYLKSVLSLNRFRLETETKKFREIVNKTEWDSHSNVAIANAYYAWLENSICM
jgi:predicted metalloendopeptidase